MPSAVDELYRLHRWLLTHDPELALITASREFKRVSIMRQALEMLPANAGIRQGGARGGDKLAVQIWGWLGRSRVEAFPVGDGWKLGKWAGNARNQRMVDTLPVPDVCLAFIHLGSRGATHCRGAALRAGIETFTFRTGEIDGPERVPAGDPRADQAG